MEYVCMVVLENLSAPLLVWVSKAWREQEPKQASTGERRSKLSVEKKP